MPLPVVFNLSSSLRVRGSGKRKKKKVLFLLRPCPCQPEGSQAKLMLTRRVPAINARFTLGNSSCLFLLSWAQRKIAVTHNLGAVPWSFLGGQEWRHQGLRTDCVLGKQWVGLYAAKLVGCWGPRLGGGVGFHYPVRNLVKSWIRLNLFVHLVRSFCSLSLRCVLQISVTPGKKEIWVKEPGSSTWLVTSQLIEKFNSGRDATRPEWKRNRACWRSEQENRRSCHPGVKKLCGAWKIYHLLNLSLKVTIFFCCLSWGLGSSPAG